MKKGVSLIMLLAILMLSAMPAPAEDTRRKLAPVYDYLELLEDHGIIIPLPDLESVRFEDRDWMFFRIGESFELSYLYYDDGLRSSLSLMVPCTYRPMEKALVLLIVSELSVTEEEAESICRKLQYNVIDEYCVMQKDEYTLTFFEPRYKNGELMGFVCLSIDSDKQ